MFGVVPNICLASRMGQRGMWRSKATGSAEYRLQDGQKLEGERLAGAGPAADIPTARRRELEQKTSGWAGRARLVSRERKETLPGPECERSLIRSVLAGSGGPNYYRHFSGLSTPPVHHDAGWHTAWVAGDSLSKTYAVFRQELR